MPYPQYDFGGDGPVVHLALANGFPPPTYAPLLAPLTADYHVISLTPRALWPQPGPPEQVTSWQMMADDLLAGLHEHHLTDVIAIGHSMGGVATMLAAIAEPGRFRAVCLLDPTFLPPVIMPVIRALRMLGLNDQIPTIKMLANGALRRRRQFASSDEAFTYYRGRRLFSDWPEATIRLYAESMTRPSSNGDGGVELVWSPEWEAHYYRTVFAGTWRAVPRLAQTVLPVLLVRGEMSNTLLPPAVARLHRDLPGMSYAEIAGHGHLFPQSAPDVTRSIITKWLAQLPE